MTRPEDEWGFQAGAPITPELTAMRLLGGGSAYEAYLAFDEITYAPVVVKVVRPGQAGDATSLRGLRREVEALATINHPGVVRGLRHHLEGERPHVVLEEVDGPRLSSLIRRQGPLPPQQYVALAMDLASVLHYLRHVGWVHLDIKPSNVIMGAPARLIDLSVARPVEAARPLTYEIGTDAYMPPEQCVPGGPQVPDFASDVWGLGATVYHAVTGYRPFDEGDPDAEDRIRRYPQLVDPPYEFPDRTPPQIVDLLVSTLDADPAARPAPHQISELLAPVMEALPRARLGGLRAR
ncbi:serine/threonine-protein kinase [Nocardioides insulae]|uniref:serine/threonine-protein kinase n=1 Tax=Nocardioides insulae TaxID=394734 RepID=UPI0003FB4A2F|nr:serine/threonine-protein kinase [Nocardioides insulae]